MSPMQASLYLALRIQPLTASKDRGAPMSLTSGQKGRQVGEEVSATMSNDVCLSTHTRVCGSDLGGPRASSGPLVSDQCPAKTLSRRWDDTSATVSGPSTSSLMAQRSEVTP